MKPIQLLTLVFFSLVISSYSYAQNLQFNSAVFYEYGGGMANGDFYIDVITTDVLVVGANQVLKITSVGSSIGGPINVGFGSFCLINNRVINVSSTSNEVYLPTGTYDIGFTDWSQYTGEVKGYISGVLYDIVP